MEEKKEDGRNGTPQYEKGRERFCYYTVQEERYEIQTMKIALREVRKKE